MKKLEAMHDYLEELIERMENQDRKATQEELIILRDMWNDSQDEVMEKLCPPLTEEEKRYFREN